MASIFSTLSTISNGGMAQMLQSTAVPSYTTQQQLATNSNGPATYGGSTSDLHSGVGQSFDGGGEEAGDWGQSDPAAEESTYSKDLLAGFASAMAEYINPLSNARATADYGDANGYNRGLEIADKMVQILGVHMMAKGGAELILAAEAAMAAATAELSTAGAATIPVLVTEAGAAVMALDGLSSLAIGYWLNFSATSNINSRKGYGESGTYRKNGHTEKKDYMKGGSKDKRDGTLSNSLGGRDFTKWVERVYKKGPKGERKLSNEEIRKAFDEWNKLGSPKPPGQ